MSTIHATPIAACHPFRVINEDQAKIVEGGFVPRPLRHVVATLVRIIASNGKPQT